MQTKIAEAFASIRERAADVRDQVRWVRESAPSLTTGLLIATTAIGFAGGWYVSKPFTRSSVNAEWRANIAAKSGRVRAIVANGNTEIEATDDDILEALGDTDAALSNAERNLKNANRPSGIQTGSIDRCRVPRECLQRK
mgnify:FL=1